jgi:flagellar protein FlgJ
MIIRYWFLLIGFFLGLGVYYVSTLEHTFRGYVAEDTFFLQEARDKAYDATLYISSSAILAASQAAYDLGLKGGQEPKCNLYFGYTLWTSMGQPYDNKCQISSSIVYTNFLEHTREILNSYIDTINDDAETLIPTNNYNSLSLVDGSLIGKSEVQMDVAIGAGTNLPSQRRPVSVSAFDTTIEIPFITAEAPTTMAPTASSNTIDTFLSKKKSPLGGIGSCILETEKRTKIPAVVILSVANHESNYGKSGLSQKSKNLFGIKCSQSYIEQACTFTNKQECCKVWSKTALDLKYEPNAPNAYRVYQDWCASINDFANLISKNQRYKQAMVYRDDPVRMIEEIRKAGYATDPNWATSIGQMIIIAQTEISQQQNIAT